MYYSVLDEGRGIDTDGIGRTVGQMQGDAIRNITGEIAAGHYQVTYTASGALVNSGGVANNDNGGWSNSMASGFKFDAGEVVPVGNRNRPINIAVFSVIRYK